jgi:hypothetical protein
MIDTRSALVSLCCAMAFVAPGCGSTASSGQETGSSSGGPSSGASSSGGSSSGSSSSGSSSSGGGSRDAGLADVTLGDDGGGALDDSGNDGGGTTVGDAGPPPDYDADWPELQGILSGIHGVAKAPIANIVTGKYTPGMLLGNGDIGVVVGDTVTTQKLRFAKSDFWGTSYLNTALSPAILQAGTLTISSTAASPNPAPVYSMTQDILDAEVDTTLQLGGATVTLRSWTADTDNVVVVELSDPAGSPDVPITLDLAMPGPDGHTTYPVTVGGTSAAIWATRQNNLTGAADVQATVAIGAALVGGAFASTATGAVDASATFTLKGGAPQQVALVFRSESQLGPGGMTTDALRQAAVADASALAPVDIDTLRAAHRDWWKQFWLQSFVQSNDATLNAYYYGALYALACASRGQNVPPSMWGLYITSDYSGWGGRYWMNYNFEAPFYGVASANRPSLMTPYLRQQFHAAPFQQYLRQQFHAAPFQQVFTAKAGYLGVNFQRDLNPNDLYPPAPPPPTPAPTKNVAFLDQKSNGTFAAMPAIWYYEYTLDTDYLKNELYPHLRQLDAFWRDYMTFDGTRYVVAHSSAHEGSVDLNPDLDLGFIRKVEGTLLQTSQVLGVDAALQPVWQDVLTKLSAFPTGTYGGKTVFLIAENVNGSTAITVTFEPGNQPINMEGAVFPGENVYVGGDPALLQIARDSLTQMNSWGVTAGGNSHNGFPKEFPIAARVGWPGADLVTKFKAAIAYQWRATNLTVYQAGGGIETSGSIETLDSMMMQSEGGVVRVFPAWPATQDAHFKRLRAKGAFLVSSELTGGQVSHVDITSEKGGTLQLADPWTTGTPQVSLLDASGNASGTTAATVNGGVVSLATTPGQSYRVTNGP